MVKKVYRVENLDCANCAAKVEAALNALPEVQEAVLTYATMQLRITAEDPDALLPKLQEAAQKVEPEVEFYPRDGAHTHHSHTGEHEHHHDCCCGHEHHHDHDHEHEHCHDHAHDHHHDDDHEHEREHHHNHEHTHEHSHDHGHEHGGEESEDLKPILVGAVLFVVGLVLDHFGLKWPTLGVCLVAYVLLGREVIVTAVKNLARGQMLDENFLMALASIGAFFTGSYTEAVGVMLFYRVGEYFEDRAVARSRSQIMEAVDLRPEVVQLVDGEAVREIPAGEANIGDIVLVRPGDRIPLDGIVVSGSSRIDTAPITGEPVPVSVAEGDSVVSGCVNTTGQLTVRVEKSLSESMVTRILDSVENAAASKPRIDRFITRFARVYTPIVVGAAVLTAIIPSLITGDWGKWVYTALTFLVMSCPCALVLSVPLAFFAGIGAGSKRGILFKGGQSMEAMSKIKAVVMDKTGTITKGDFTVQKIVGGDELLELCADCEQQSTHPIAESIVAAAKARNMELRRPEELEELAGRGIRAKLDGKEILCGNERLLTEKGVSFPKSKEYRRGERRPCPAGQRHRDGDAHRRRRGIGQGRCRSRRYPGSPRGTAAPAEACTAAIHPGDQGRGHVRRRRHQRRPRAGRCGRRRGHGQRRGRGHRGGGRGVHDLRRGGGAAGAPHFQTDRPDCVAECGVRSGGEAGRHDPRPVRLCLHVAGGDRRFRRGAAVRPEFHSHLI